MTAPLVVGFDLDMTLFDTEPSIAATLAATASDLGVDFDVEMVMADLGPPLEVQAAKQLPRSVVKAFVARFRKIYHLHGLPAARLLPGARESIAAVAGHDGRSIVITGKNDRDANLHVAAENLEVSHVIGRRWAEGKTAAMLEHGARVYIGDHPADVAAAKAADAFGDADVVLPSLSGFPAWLARHLESVRRGVPG